MTGPSGGEGAEPAASLQSRRGQAAETLAAVAPHVPENRANRFAHVDAMRAFAVGLVLLEHAGITIAPGDSGVTVFFTISGFIITFLLLRERESTGRFNARRFYRRRALKLAPPFVVAILVPTAVWAFFGPLDVRAVASQVLFSYNWLQIYANELSFRVLPGSNVVWSLGVEEQFYIAFSLIWLVLVRTSSWRPVLIGLAVVAIVAANLIRLQLLLTDGSRDHLLRGTDARMDALAWGVLAAVAYVEHRNGRLSFIRVLRTNLVLPIAGVVYLALVVVQAHWSEVLLRPGVYPILAAAVILYGLMPNGSRVQAAFYRISSWRPVAVMGLASYSIYLAHAPLMAIPFDWLGAELGPAGRVAVLLPSGLIAGLVLWRLVEVPVLRIRTRAGW